MTNEQPAEAAPGLIEQIVDHAMAILPPYETSVYLYLLRHSRLIGSPAVRVGKRTIGEGLGRGTRSRIGGNYQHITEKLAILAQDGFISIGETDRRGTLYKVALPGEVPAIRERIASVQPPPTSADHYRDPALRQELFERDGWRCHYCGEAVNADAATLDHVHPISQGGANTAENLATACLMCNSIKSGRTYEEAAPDLLKAIQAKRTRD